MHELITYFDTHYWQIVAFFWLVVPRTIGTIEIKRK